jgi:hypothetical protein
MMIKNNLFKKVDSEGIMLGGVEGVILGGISGVCVGALYNAFKAKDEINSVPIETVTLT